MPQARARRRPCCEGVRWFGRGLVRDSWPEVRRSRRSDMTVLPITPTVGGVLGNAVLLRDGQGVDADPLTAVMLRSRATAMPWLRSPHDEASTRWWMEHVVLAEQNVRVAYIGSQVVGFAAVDGAWLEQLWVDPAEQGRGVGSRLLEDAQAASRGRLTLHVFTRNQRARRFYEAAGFILTSQSDGSSNEEQEPDCTYTWTASR